MKRDINSIRPDPNQPRKIFDEQRISRLGVSLLNEGMINPIEIDKDGMIITGENRWRAARVIGWKEVPVTINETPYDSYGRLRHQMAENLHQSGSDTPMNPIDQASAFKFLLEQRGWSADSEAASHSVTRDSSGKLTGSTGDHYVTTLAEELGINPKTIYDFLHYLELPEFSQNALKEGTPRTYFDEVNKMKLPEEAKNLLMEKIAEGKIVDRGELRQIAKIAKQDQALAITEIERRNGIIDAKTSSKTNRILNNAIALSLALEELVFKDVHIKEKNIVRKQLEVTLQDIQNYLSE